MGERWEEGVGRWRKMEEDGREVGERCREVEKDGGTLKEVEESRRR